MDHTLPSCCAYSCPTHSLAPLRPTRYFFPPQVGDGDPDVRLALRSLMRERVMPLLQPGVVRPFMPVIMAHVSR